MDNSIYEVERTDYASFVKTIKPEYREITTYKDGKYMVTQIKSKLTGNLLCARKSHNIKNESKRQPEKYYIFNLPSDEERLPPVPTVKIELETKEEVQAFFDYLSKQNKEKENNDGVI